MEVMRRMLAGRWLARLDMTQIRGLLKEASVLVGLFSEAFFCALRAGDLG